MSDDSCGDLCGHGDFACDTSGSAGGDWQPDVFKDAALRDVAFDAKERSRRMDHVLTVGWPDRCAASSFRLTSDESQRATPMR